MVDASRRAAIDRSAGARSTIGSRGRTVDAPTSRIANCGAGDIITRCTRARRAGRPARPLTQRAGCRVPGVFGLRGGPPGVPRRRGNVVRGGAGIRSSVRWPAMFLVVVLAFAACGGGDDDDSASSPDSNDASTDQTGATPSGDLTALEVDRSSRFAGRTPSASRRPSSPRKHRRRPTTASPRTRSRSRRSA